MTWHEPDTQTRIATPNFGYKLLKLFNLNGLSYFYLSERLSINCDIYIYIHIYLGAYWIILYDAWYVSYDVWNWKQKDEHCMNAFQKKVLDECIGDAHTLLYEKNKGLIRVGKVMNGSSVIPCCKFSVKKL